MVDTFIDPLDTAPVTSGKSSYSSPVRVPPNQQDGQSFHEILRSQVKHKPTPIIMPESLQPPKIESQPRHAEGSDPLNRMNARLLPAQNLPNQHNVSSEPPLSPTPKAAGLFANTGDASAPNQSSGKMTKANETVLPPDIQERKPLAKNDQEAAVQSKPDRVDKKEAIKKEAIKNGQAKNESITHEPVNHTSASKSTEASKPVRDRANEKVSTEYRVKPGDTLSGIVASALREKEVEFRTADIYRLVDVVAQENGIRNPDVIYAGSRIDLSAVYQGTIASNRSNSTAFLDGMQIPASGKITSEFGMRTHPIHKDERFHNGIDIAMDTGTPVRAFQPGTVSFAGEMGGYGNVVEVEHEKGTRSRYGHLSEIHVQEGDRVDLNDTVGLSGNSGLSTGPHLHFEISREGRAIDPLTLLSAEQIETQHKPEQTRLAQNEASPSNA